MDRGGFVHETVQGAGLGPDKGPSVSGGCTPSLPEQTRLRPRGLSLIRLPRLAPLGSQLNPAGRAQGLSAASCCQPGQARGHFQNLGPPAERSLSGSSCLAGGVLQQHLGWSQPPRPPPRPLGPSLGTGQTRHTGQECIPDLLIGLDPGESLAWGPSLPPNHSPPPSSSSGLQLCSRAHGAPTLCLPTSKCLKSLLESLRPALSACHALSCPDHRMGPFSSWKQCTQNSLPSRDCC